MKIFPALLAVAAFATASLPALADSKCSISKASFGQMDVLLNGSALMTSANMNDALIDMKSLKDAGLCEDAQSKCSISKGSFGQVEVLLNGSSLQTSANLKDSLVVLKSLRDTGLCEASTKSNCSLSKGSFGQVNVMLNGSSLQTSANLTQAIADLQKVSESGLCGEVKANSMGSCRATQSARGISLFMDNGATLIDTYREEYTARAVFAALVKAGACR